MPDGLNSQRPPWGSILAILGAALIWSTSFAVTKVLLNQLPPLTIGAVRFTAAALILCVLVRMQSGWRPPPRRTVVKMLCAGLLGITAYFGLENVGVDFATAADAAVIVAAFPVITLITEILLGQGKVTVSRVAGMLLAMAGVWLIVRQSAESSAPHRLLGDVILLVAGVAWAAYNIAASRSGKGHSPLTNTYYQTIAGAFGFLVLCPLEWRSWRMPDTAGLGMLAFLAVMCSVVAFFLYNHGLRRVPSSTAVNLLNLVPVFGLISAAAISHEPVGWIEIVGCAVVIAAVVLGAGYGLPVRRGRNRTVAASPAATPPAVAEPAATSAPRSAREPAYRENPEG
ncbi:DMT family transporter [Streptomyces sioyaensis]|uniref:DMT family transporter n=1 Tax=Streptomyces sioyaensis TaxID=67364 RepID=UPI0036604D99